MILSTSTYQAYESNMEFFRSFRSKDEDELISPICKGKWSVKEIIGHIYYWDLFLLEKMVPEMKEGGVLPDFPDHDEYNEKAIQAIMIFNDTEALIKEFVLTRKELIRNLENLNQGVRFTIGKKSANSLLNLF